jgi:hypothetical protein
MTQIIQNIDYTSLARQAACNSHECTAPTETVTTAIYTLTGFEMTRNVFGKVANLSAAILKRAA